MACVDYFFAQKNCRDHEILKKQRLASISATIFDLKDLTFVYGTYLDGGTVNRLSRRIALRFALSTD